MNIKLINLLKEGKIKLYNTGTPEQLRKILTIAFPCDTLSKSEFGIFRYYMANDSIKGRWQCFDMTSEVQCCTTEDFFKEEEEESTKYTIDEILNYAGNKYFVVEVKNEQQYKILKFYFPSMMLYRKESDGYLIHKINSGVASFKHYSNTDKYIQVSFNNIILKHMKKTKEIVGYKLIKPEYEEAALKIAGLNNWSPSSMTTEYQLFRSDCIQKIREAGVLDLWFEPVYETKEKVIVLSNGKSVIVNKDSVKVENIIIKIVSIQNLLNQVSYLDDTSWRITSNSYDIGCWKNVLRSDLELIINTAKIL